MSAIISESSNILSPLTLALLEDSGWYFANYANSAISPFGHGAGCDFIRKPCLVKTRGGQTTVPDYSSGSFCSENAAGCSPSNHFKMFCGILDYSNDAGPPPKSQYFNNENYGGYAQMDYCPLFSAPYLEGSGDCRDPSFSDTYVHPSWQEYYGSNSMCFTSSLGSPLCYEHKCDPSSRKLSVRALGVWRDCEEDFQEIVPDPLFNPTFKITCPKLATACPDMFCPLNCEGRGYCNWDARGGAICECFDPKDKTASCSERNGAYFPPPKDDFSAASGRSIGVSKAVLALNAAVMLLISVFVTCS